MKSGFGELALLLLAVFAVGSITMQPSRRTAAASNTTAPRFSHTATLLPNGKLLIAGGMERNGVFLATAELYDPATGRFAPAGKMGATRGFGSTATLLPHGKVLITGSWGDSSDYYAAVLMKDGKVLVVGGSSAGQHRNTRVEASAEVYDPSTGRFTPTDRMRTPASQIWSRTLARRKSTHCRRPDGRPVRRKTCHHRNLRPRHGHLHTRTEYGVQALQDSGGRRATEESSHSSRGRCRPARSIRSRFPC